MKIFKKLTAVIISLVTVFAMFPAVNITASAYSYTGLDEIGGKVLIESSKSLSFLSTMAVAVVWTHTSLNSTVK